MDYQSLSNVLGVLRLMKGENLASSTADAIRRWSGQGVSEAGILKVGAYIQEQVESAQIVIANSQLSDEAKEGIDSVLAALRQTFALGGLNNQLGAHVGNVAGAISNFAILLSAMGLAEKAQIPPEANELVHDIEALLGDFESAELDPVVRDVAKRHLKMLSTLLQHIPIFGMEAALATYFELVMKVRRADIGTSDESKEKLSPLWDRIKGYGEKLASLDNIVNSGARLISHAGKAKDLLAYLPDIPDL